MISKSCRVTYVLAGALICALASCKTYPAPAVPARSVTVPPDFMGVTHAGNPVLAEENALMDELGIVWVRNDFLWDKIESKQGEWTYEAFDKMVAENKKAGRKILAILSFDNKWLYKNNKRKDYISPEHLPLYLAYVEKTVSRYKGKVDAWEIWNEPNVPIRFWNGPAKDFFALSGAAAKKIKEADPAAYVVAGAFFRSPSSFIKRMWRSGAMEQVDALSVHPYATTPRAALAVYDRFETQIRRLGFRGDIWVTEIGYPVAGFYPSRVPEKKLGDYIIKTISPLAARGAKTIFWYQLSESYLKANTPKTLNSEKFFGLAYKDFEKRSGAESLAALVQALAGSEYVAEWPGKAAVKQGTSAYCFRRLTGEYVLVSWRKNAPARITLINRKEDE